MAFDEPSSAGRPDPAVAQPLRSRPAGGVVLVCYDGSDGSRVALEAALVAFDRPMLVACYWQAFAKSSRGLRVEVLEIVQDRDSVNTRELEHAQAIAEEGAAIVSAAGGLAEAVAVELTGPLKDAILEHATRLDAVAIVLGGQIRTGLRSMLAGDVTGEIVRAADQPVFLVSDHRHHRSHTRPVRHRRWKLRLQRMAGAPKLLKMIRATSPPTIP